MTDEQDQKRGLFGRRKSRLTDGPLFPDDDVDNTFAADTSSLYADGRLSEDLPQAERYPPIPTADDLKRDDTPIVDQPQVQSEPYADRRRRRPGNWRHDLVAFIFAIATVGLCGTYAIIWNDPWTAINPLAPATEFYFVTETPDPLAVANAAVTATALAQPTEVGFAAQGSFSGLPFVITDAGVLYTPNGNGSGCDWASIGGTVTGLNGEPLNGFRVRITDAENPDQFQVEVFSGAVVTFGDGGFEYPLGNTPRAGRYDVQLFSSAGAPLSDAYRIVTRDRCEENVAIVTFVQVAPM